MTTDPTLPPGLADTHLHTHLCKHAEGAPSDYLCVAAARGLDEVCFTDHVPDPGGYDHRHRMTMEQMPEYRRLVQDAAAKSPIPVNFGIEADYYEGCESFLADWLPRQGFDVVLGSVHYIEDWAFDNPEDRPVWDRADVPGTWRKYFVLLERLAATRLFDVVSHLDLPKKFGHRPTEQDQCDMAAPALDAIADAGMAVELNTSGLLKPVKEIYPSALILDMMREREIPVCFGSDAHRPKHVGFAFEQALDLVREAGYSEYMRFRAREQIATPLPAPVQ